ncbi:MAG: hypothetical protein ACRDQ2_09450 [Gaiellales bacterium]
MPIERSLIRQVRSLDEYDLRRLLIFVRGLLVQRGIPPRPLDEPAPRPGKVSYRLQPVRCGKPGCTKCPHGPYWYAYWREGGRVRSRYLGRRAPQEPEKGPGPASQGPPAGAV